jgi:hypothetical protein
MGEGAWQFNFPGEMYTGDWSDWSHHLHGHQYLVRYVQNTARDVTKRSPCVGKPSKEAFRICTSCVSRFLFCVVFTSNLFNLRHSMAYKAGASPAKCASTFPSSRHHLKSHSNQTCGKPGGPWDTKKPPLHTGHPDDQSSC